MSTNRPVETTTMTTDWSWLFHRDSTERCLCWRTCTSLQRSKLSQTEQTQQTERLRRRVTSYSTLMQTMYLTYTVFEWQWVICQKSTILTYPTFIWRWPCSNFSDIFRTQKTESLGYWWRCLRDSIFSRFESIPACDRQKDRQTYRRTDGQINGQIDTQRQHIYRASIASRGNKMGRNCSSCTTSCSS